MQSSKIATSKTRTWQWHISVTSCYETTNSTSTIIIHVIIYVDTANSCTCCVVMVSFVIPVTSQPEIEFTLHVARHVLASWIPLCCASCSSSESLITMASVSLVLDRVLDLFDGLSRDEIVNNSLMRHNSICDHMILGVITHAEVNLVGVLQHPLHPCFLRLWCSHVAMHSLYSYVIAFN